MPNLGIPGPIIAETCAFIATSRRANGHSSPDQESILFVGLSVFLPDKQFVDRRSH